MDQAAEMESGIPEPNKKPGGNLGVVKQEMLEENEAISRGLKSIPTCNKSNTNERNSKPEKDLPKSEDAQEAESAELDQPTTNAKATTKSRKKGPTQVKRKSETGSNEGPATKKPRAYRKPRQETLEAAKYVSHTNSLILRGKSAKLPKGIDVKLPTICQAPSDLRGHLKGLEAAGLRLSKAVPATIKNHIKVLSGLCHAFTGLEPHLIERVGEPRVDDFKWKLQGLNHPLHSHQVLGSAIMIVIEKDESQGSGLLLDFMGFGKTVQTLACIVSNRVRSRKRQRPTDGSATTLVVVPKSAATQWVEEVKRHADQLTVMLWTRQTEFTRDSTLAVDILVVTYDQVRMMRKMSKTGKQPTSLLFDACYQRIVLDEAHKIKNRSSDIFEACMKLRGNHRWALTGTPIPNGVHELWPLLAFIQHPSVKAFAEFKKDYLIKQRGKKLKGAAPYEKLHELLLPISIMRAPGHQFCGLPLVSLPQDHAVKEVVTLSAEDKVILGYLEEYIMGYIQKRCGGRSNYFCLMERFMRFRQFSASPLLLEWPVKDGLWTIDQVRLMKQEAHNAGAGQTPIIDLFERWILEPRFDCLAPTGIKKYDSVLAETDGILCPRCSRRPNEPMKAECGHIWCNYCSTDWQQYCSVMGREFSCFKCRRPMGELRPSSPNDDGSGQNGDETKRPRGDDHNGFQPADDERSTLFQFLDKHPEEPIPLSSKMKRTLDIILKWQAEAPEDKIIGKTIVIRPKPIIPSNTCLIVFLHFIGTSRLLARSLQDHGIGYLYFVGQMNSDQRRNARLTFEEEPVVKVFVSQLLSYLDR